MTFVEPRLHPLGNPVARDCRRRGGCDDEQLIGSKYLRVVVADCGNEMSEELLLRDPKFAGAGPVSPRVIVVEPRAFIAGSLCRWLSSLGSEFDGIAVASIDAVGGDILGRASAVLFGTASPAPAEDEWLRNEVVCTQSRRKDLPLALFADTTDLPLVENAIREFALSGYIPTSTGLELAGAAIRLILAGERYFPELRHQGHDAKQPGAPPMQSASAQINSLTPRERTVLALLERGVPNKIIARRLEMSPSTVKAHVHNIIVKLGVRNRTEAALIRYERPRD